jgi:hypothetical protein
LRRGCVVFLAPLESGFGQHMVPPPTTKRRPSLSTASKSDDNEPPTKRRSSSQHQPSVSITPRPAFRQSKSPTPALIARQEKAKKRNEALQVSIPFNTVDKYRPGLKLLLPETVYDDPTDVSFFVFDYFIFNTSHDLTKFV